jgi:hypothetical protein
MNRSGMNMNRSGMNMNRSGMNMNRSDMILVGWRSTSTGNFIPSTRPYIPSRQFIPARAKKHIVGAPKQFVGAPKQFVGAPKQFVGAPKQFVSSSLDTLKHLSGLFTIQKSEIVKMSAVELADFLKSRLCISPLVMKKLIYEEVDGKAFILMKKANLNFLGLGKNHIMLCLIVPSALFVDDFLEMV